MRGYPAPRGQLLPRFPWRPWRRAGANDADGWRNDLDPRSGLELLFEEGKHFLGYTNKADLETQMIHCMAGGLQGTTIAEDASNLVREKHLIINRAEQILEVVNAN